jgi:TM2 domain-containing membrane protein YozV
MPRLFLTTFFFLSVYFAQSQFLFSKALSESDEKQSFYVIEGRYQGGGKELCMALGQENARLVAIALDVALGLFGMHRMYLGTDIQVPIFYTLTVGGGCILWLVDLGLLIFSKDIEKYKNNPHVFMWLDKKD